MKLFPVLFLLTFGLAHGASNQTDALFDITKKALDLFPSLRNIARQDSERKETIAETTIKRISDIFSNFRPRERLMSPEGGGLMRRITDTLEPVLNPIRNLTEMKGPRERLMSQEGGGLMRRITDTLEPVLNPLRNLTAHVAGNRTIYSLIPKRST